MCAITKFAGIVGKKMKPTLKHRPAMWENMLGTVYAMNDKREIKYFDYNYTEAMVYAGINNDKDIRIFACPKTHSRHINNACIKLAKRVIFILE